MSDTAQQVVDRVTAANEELQENLKKRTEETRGQLDQAVKAWISYFEDIQGDNEKLLEALTESAKSRTEILSEQGLPSFLDTAKNGKAADELSSLITKLAEQDKAITKELVSQVSTRQTRQIALAKSLFAVPVTSLQTSQKLTSDLAQYGQTLVESWYGVVDSLFTVPSSERKPKAKA